MARYGIGEDAAVDALRAPDSLLDGHSGRRIAQKRLNHYVLRVIFEDEQDGPVVVTVYRAKRDRYEV